MKKVLYVGSGKSTLLVKNIDTSKYVTICVNNAWRIFENNFFDYWIHSGDFPYENHPKNKNFHTEISYLQYEPAIKKLAKTLEIKEETAVFDIGYTIFFQGLYWIFEVIKPNEIYTLGFDHDYNPEKTKKWIEQGKPTPQNGFKKDKEESIEKWSNRVYGGFEPDFFYGHGTPDPLRLGDHHLKEKFKFAIKNSEKLGIKLYNASPVISEINSWEKKLLV